MQEQAFLFCAYGDTGHWMGDDGDIFYCDLYIYFVDNLYNFNLVPTRESGQRQIYH